MGRRNVTMLEVLVAEVSSTEHSIAGWVVQGSERVSEGLEYG